MSVIQNTIQNIYPPAGLLSLEADTEPVDMWITGPFPLDFSHNLIDKMGTTHGIRQHTPVVGTCHVRVKEHIMGTPNGEPLRWLLDAIQRETDACVEWPYGRDKDGYGRIRVGPTTIRSHIHILRLTNPQSDNRMALHTCDNPPCVNPRHLWWGTHQDNMDDKAAKARNSVGERHGLAKLTEAAVRSIRASVGMTQAELARQYDVCPETIGAVLRRRTWTHV